jgi:hypothetical protein
MQVPGMMLMNNEAGFFHESPPGLWANVKHANLQGLRSIGPAKPNSLKTSRDHFALLDQARSLT